MFGAFYVAALVRNGGLMRFLPGLPKVRFVSGDSAKGTEARQRGDWRKPKVVDADEVSGEDFISQEVDPILDKISKQGIHSLTERERKVLELRFGLSDGYSRTLEEVGKQFKVTRERIRQIEAKALRKMRHPTRIRQLSGFLEREDLMLQ